MAPKVGIEITADTFEAIQSLEKLGKGFEDIYKSPRQLAKELAQSTVALDKFVKDARTVAKDADFSQAAIAINDSTNAIVKSLARQHDAYRLTMHEGEAYKKTLKTIDSVLTTMGTSGASSDSITQIMKLRNEIVAQQDTLKALQKEENKFDVTKFNNSIEAQAAIVRSVSGDLKALETLQTKLSAKAIKLFEEGDENNAEKLAVQLKFVNQEIEDIGNQKSYIDEFAQSVKLASKQAEQFRSDNIKEFEQSIKLAKEQAQEFAQGRFFELVGDEVNSLKTKMSALKKSIEQNISAGHENSKATQDMVEQYKALNAQYEVATKRTVSFGVRIKNLISGFVSAQAIVFLLRKSFTLFTQGIKEASDAAGAAEETLNLYMTTFQHVADQAAATASTLAGSFKIANSTAQESLGIFGDLAIGFGLGEKEALKFAETSAKLTMDLISFKNLTGDTSEIMRKFASGLAGNTENFRVMGIVVKDAEIKLRLAAKGLSGLTGKALEAAKMQERLNIAIEQSPNAIGDMVKTLNSTQNVNRKLDESIKAWQERLGKGVNTWLTPMKSAIYELIDGWNKAAIARENYEGGKSNDGLYFKRDESGDLIRDTKTEKKILNKTNISLFNHPTQVISPAMKSFDALNEQAQLYGITINELIDIMEDWGVKVPKDIKKSADEWWVENEQIIKANQAIAHRITLMENASASAQTFADSLNEIPNINIKIPNITQSLGNIAKSQISTDAVLGGIGRNVSDAIKKSFSQLSSADWEEFVSPLDYALNNALGKSMKNDGLTAKLKAVASYFEIIRNYSLQDGKISEEEQAVLDDILENYKKIGIEIENITKKTNAQKAIEDALASAIKSQADFTLENKTKDAHTNEDESIVALRVEQEKQLATIKEQFNIAKSLTDNEQELQELTAKNNQAEAAINKLYEDRINLQKKLVQGQAFSSKVNSLSTIDKTISGIGKESTPLTEARDEYFSNLDKMSEVANKMLAAGSTIKEITDYQYEMEGKINDLYAKRLTAATEAAEKEMAAARLSGESQIQAISDQNERTIIEMSSKGVTRDEALAQFDMSAQIRDFNKSLAETYGILNENGQAVGKGNIDLNALMKLVNPDGTTSTIHSFSTEIDGKQVVLPQVYDGVRLSMEEAVQKFLDAGGIEGGASYLGAFDTIEEAEAYAQKLHEFEELKLGYEDEITEQTRLQLEKQKQAWYDSQGEKVYRQGDVNTILTGFEADGPVGAVVALLAEWASKLEVVNKLSTVLTDSIMPALNGLLEPLLPFIKIFGEAITAVADIIAAVYPVLQVVGTVLVYVGSALKQVGMLLQAFGKTLEYIVTFKWGKLGSVWSDFAKDSGDMWKDANKQVADIWSKDFANKIGQMSDELKGKLNAYEDLYAKGILSAGEAEALIQKNIYGRNIDTTIPTSVGDAAYVSKYITSTGTTNVNYGGVTIKIDGAGDPEAVARATIRMLENMDRKDGSYNGFASA